MGVLFILINGTGKNPCNGKLNARYSIKFNREEL